MAGPLRITGVEGLRQLARDLKEIDPKLAKRLYRVGKTVGDSVRDAARDAFQALHPSRSGDGARTIKTYASQTRVRVAFGDDRVPYMNGLEFGSGQGPTTRQFPAYKPSPSGRGGEGYFFFPSLREETEDLDERYARELDVELRDVFPD